MSTNIISGTLGLVESKVHYVMLLDASGNSIDTIQNISVSGGSFNVPTTTVNNGIVTWSGTNGTGVLSPSFATVSSAGALSVASISTGVINANTVLGNIGNASTNQINVTANQTSFIGLSGAILDLVNNASASPNSPYISPWVDIVSTNGNPVNLGRAAFPFQSLYVNNIAPFSASGANINGTLQTNTIQLSGAALIENAGGNITIDSEFNVDIYANNVLQVEYNADGLVLQNTNIQPLTSGTSQIGATQRPINKIYSNEYVLYSPNGVTYKLSVSNAGALTVVSGTF